MDRLKNWYTFVNDTMSTRCIFFIWHPGQLKLRRSPLFALVSFRSYLSFSFLMNNRSYRACTMLVTVVFDTNMTSILNLNRRSSIFLWTSDQARVIFSNNAYPPPSFHLSLIFLLWLFDYIRQVLYLIILVVI